MNIEVLEGFLEVVRLGSIAKASERLHISHPALSKQIRKMEQYYGVTLFHSKCMKCARFRKAALASASSLAVIGALPHPAQAEAVAFQGRQ